MFKTELKKLNLATNLGIIALLLILESIKSSICCA